MSTKTDDARSNEFERRDSTFDSRTSSSATKWFVQPIDEPSRRSKIVYHVLRRTTGPLLRRVPLSDVSLGLRGLLDKGFAVLPRPKGVAFETVEFDGFDAELLTALPHEGGFDHGAVIYMHGGAFIMGGLNTHRRVAANLARLTRMPVLNVGYRQLPETGIGGSTADCVRAYQWLVERLPDSAPLVLVGDSAGGMLVFSTALTARKLHLRPPSGLVGISPWLDLDSRAKRHWNREHKDAYLPLSVLASVSERDALSNDPLRPEVSPFGADLSALPPVHLVVAESEMLRVDAESMRARLEAFGVTCELKVWRGQVHAFPSLLPGLPESRAVLREIANFIRSSTSQSANPTNSTAQGVPHVRHP